MPSGRRCWNSAMSVGTRNKALLARLAAVAALMCAASWGFVPLYDWFCRVTGFGGATLRAEAGSAEALDRAITIRFDASKERGMPWEFRPLERKMKLRIGESGLAFYEAHNPTSVAVAGAASYNVHPFSAGGYFVKVQCFCFEEQVLQPGESVQMPVSFYVDPDIVNDPEAGSVGTITLSYTFHRVDLPPGGDLRPASAQARADEPSSEES